MVNEPSRAFDSQPSGFVSMRFQEFSTPIPTPVTSLIGRDREIDAVLELVRDPVVRLVSLTGPGGVGKTRLAIQIASLMAKEGSDDVAFVDLATVPRAELVAQTIAQAVGVRLSTNQPPLERLEISLRGHSLLLVLDNFEHLIGAGEILVQLLTSCPRLTMLVTSRSVLNLSGEHVVQVPPLGRRSETDGRGVIGQNASEMSLSDAEQLFVERAAAINPSFRVRPDNVDAVSEICARLDGLPLAIEMAAARSYLFSPNELVRRLDHRLPMLTGGARDLPARQQTMRNTIDWSFDLLDAEEQAALRRLSVFVGEWSLDAASEVCWSLELDETTHKSQILPVIESLVRQSLVTIATPSDQPSAANGPRFRLLETIREFAAVELFGANELDLVRDRHATYFASEAAKLDPIFWGDEPGDARSIIAAEIGNYRAALDWALRQKDTETALRLAGSIFDPEATLDMARLIGLDTLGQLGIVESALALPGGTDDARAAALCKASHLANAHGDSTRALKFADDALEYARRSGDAMRYATASFVQGKCSFRSGELDDALHWLDIASREFRALGAHGRAAWVQCTIASSECVDAPLNAGKENAALAKAVERCESALSVFRRTGNEAGISRALGGKAYALYKQGDLREAMKASRELLTMSWEEGRVVISCLEDIADIAARMGEPAFAARLHGAIDADRRTLRQVVPPVFDSEVEEEIEFVRSALGNEEFSRQWEVGFAMPVDGVIAEALTVAERILDSSPVELTPREQQVLALLGEELTAQEIADRLYLSPRTVEYHLRNLYSKLNVHTRSEAVSAASAAGILGVD